MPTMDWPAPLGLERLRAVVAVARTGGFSAAARALARSQSSVSQAVAALEDELGVLLVIRDGRRTHLTDAGRVLVEHAERVFAAIVEARTAVEAARTVPSGRLALGASDTFAMYLLPPVLAELRRRYPTIELRLHNRPSPEVARQVAARTLDAGLVSLPLPSGLRIDGQPIVDRLRVIDLASLAEVAIVAPDHALARRRGVDLGRLAQHPLVLLDRNTASRAHLDAALADRGLSTTVAMEMNSVEVIKRLVMLGFGAAVVPEISIRAERDRAELRALPIAGLARRRCGLVVPHPGPPTNAANALVALARELLEGAQPAGPPDHGTNGRRGRSAPGGKMTSSSPSARRHDASK